MTSILAMPAKTVDVAPKLAAILADIAATEQRLERLWRDRAAQLRHLHRLGYTWAELGDMLGVSRQRAQQMSVQH